MVTGGGLGHIYLKRDDHDQRQRCQRRGKGNLEVSPELVFHLAALGGAGGNGGVGDEGQVIAKHTAAHDGCHAQGQAETGILGNGHGDGGQQGDGANGGTHGHGHEAGHYEQNGHRQLGRGDGQQEVGHGLGTAAAGDTHEDARCQEYQDHGDDVPVTDALPHEGQFFIKGNASVLKARHQNGHQKGNYNGDLVKAHLHLQHILQYDAQSQIQSQENGNGQQCDRPGCVFWIHCFSPQFYQYCKYLPRPSNSAVKTAYHKSKRKINTLFFQLPVKNVDVKADAAVQLF